MISNHDLERVVNQINDIIAGLVKRIEKCEEAHTTKVTKSKEKS